MEKDLDQLKEELEQMLIQKQKENIDIGKVLTISNIIDKCITKLNYN